VAHYIMLYNFFRPHYSLNYLTPVEKFLEGKKSNMLWTHTIICTFYEANLKSLHFIIREGAPLSGALPPLNPPSHES